jgi:predicted nucleic acid-binding protein
VNKIITLFRKRGIFTDRTDFEASLPDETDRVFLEISLTVEDSYLVTGNLKHYPRIPKVITPAEFIRLYLINL